MDSLNKPNFLIVGAARSGTTALFEYLAQHPEVFISEPKEPHYFAFCGQTLRFRGPGDNLSINRKAVTDRQAYMRLFRAAGSATAVGEASVSYLYYPETIAQIKREIPNAKLICILRQPADRAYSAYSYLRSLALEPCREFRHALLDEERRVTEGWHHLWHYRNMGRYKEQLQRYVNAFPPEQLRVYLYDDFIRDPLSIISDCFVFLGVNPAHTPNRIPTSLVSGIPRGKLATSVIPGARFAKRLLKPMLPKRLVQLAQARFMSLTTQKHRMHRNDREELTRDFREDILGVQEILKRDLSQWLAVDDTH